MMSKYRKKPVVIDASQWFRTGDHEAVYTFSTSSFRELQMECPHCKLKFELHGHIPTLEGVHIVCPGDWIITGVKGENYPCKPDIFEVTYEPAI